MTAGPAPDAVDDGLAYSAELVEQLEQIEQDCALPWWFGYAAAAAIVLGAAASAVWPWGFAA